MTCYLFFSHDGFGLGHARRNSLIARSVLARDPAARVVVVTGVARRLAWLSDERVKVVRVPPLLKDSSGGYRSGTMSFEEAVARRARLFIDEVRRAEPDVVVVDRHPYGTGGELRYGLELARGMGALTVLGLRDVLDEPGVIAREIAGEGWADVCDLYDRILVYGAPHIVDHVAEYGLPMTPQYCGWVVAAEPYVERETRLLVISAGGGGDGRPVFELGRRLVELRPSWRGVVAAGPYSSDVPALTGCTGSTRLQVLRHVSSCGPLFRRADTVLCMAGYNSTIEALAAGRRPILVPRRSPRREQAIRAGRLAALGLAHVVDEGAAASEVSWLLDREQNVSPEQLEAAGIRLDGADTVAHVLMELARAGSMR